MTEIILAKNLSQSKKIEPITKTEEEIKPEMIFPNTDRTVDFGDYEHFEVKQEKDAEIDYAEETKQENNVQIEYVGVKQEPVEYYKDPVDSCNDTHSEKSTKEDSSPPVKRRSKNFQKIKPKRPYYECKKCFEKFPNMKGLKKHREEIKHPPKSQGLCPVCNKMFGYSLKQHMRTHTGEKPYDCDICGASFRMGSNLSRHKLALHSTSNDRVYRCKTCEKFFKNPHSLKAHQKRETEAKRRNEILSKDFQCTECDQAFATKILLERHSVVHGCLACGKVFRKLHDLKNHQLIHTGEQPYVCSACSKAFIQPSKLEIHMRIHTGEKPYSCEVCSKAFTQSTHLKDHMRIHTGEKPYNCKICSKAFSQSYGFKIHMRQHTGEKPYSCAVCDKSFSMSHSLTVHKRTHTGEKPYVCPLCGKGFHNSSARRRHERTHGEQHLVPSNVL